MVVYLKNKFSEAGYATLFAARFFQEVFRPPLEIKEFSRQCYILGYKSLPLVGVTAFIMGLVMTLQSRPTLVEFGAEAWLPGMVALSLVKEIAPVITAVICAGKIASAIGAELGSMKVTEQIDAMEVSGVNPYKYLVVTRVLATTFMIPLLVIFADAIGIFGSYISMNIHTEITLFRFLSKAMASIEFIDIVPATIKTFFFGFFVGMIGCYKGFTAANGTESVGRAANAAVVSASITIFIIDMIAVQLTDLFL